MNTLVFGGPAPRPFGGVRVKEEGAVRANYPVDVILDRTGGVPRCAEAWR